MGVYYLNRSSSGSTRNSGTNGDLCTLLDWALNTTAGVAIEYTAANARVYRGTNGNRFRLHVRHDSAASGDARLCLIRGCEDATTATALTDPFPLAAQVADGSSNWLVSTTANTTDRAYHILVWDDATLDSWGIIYASNVSGAADVWDIGWFIDRAPGRDSGDNYASCVGIRATSSTSATFTALNGNQAPYASNTFWARDITGVTKSTYGCLWFPVSGTTPTRPGLIPNTPAARGGYANRVRRDKIALTCTGSSTTTPNTLAILKRGWFPFLFEPLHNGLGTLHEADDFQDNADVNITLKAIPLSASVASEFAILQTYTTWTPPS